MPEVDIHDTSVDIQVDCPDVSTTKTFVPPETDSIQKDKGKSILVDQDIPFRVKTKVELANEKLSEIAAAHLQAKEEAAATKVHLDMQASDALARKIQADLDQMGPSLTSTLPAERQKELDEIAKTLSAKQ